MEEIDSVYCLNCRRAISRASTFCSSCGQDQRPVYLRPQPAPQVNRCGTCSKLYDATASHCPWCAVRPAAPQDTPLSPAVGALGCFGVLVMWVLTLLAMMVGVYGLIWLALPLDLPAVGIAIGLICTPVTFNKVNGWVKLTLDGLIFVAAVFFLLTFPTAHR